MKLLLISLSVVFCFSCSKDTPTSPPIAPKIELDTSLKKQDGGGFYIKEWSSANEEWVITERQIRVDEKWRFISATPIEMLGINNFLIKGGYTIEYSNPNPISVVFSLGRLSFVDKDEIPMAEYSIGDVERNISANGDGSYSFDFEIYLANIGLANEITKVSLWASVIKPL